jgi:beta-N-acetylhexosaminidase
VTGVKAAIVGIGGLELEQEEAAVFAAYPPAGVILFARNIQDPAQLAYVTASLCQVLPSHAVLMVDQEGGRVARLRPPHWRAHPAAADIGRLFDASPVAGLRAAWLTGALIGEECAAAGFDVVAAPVLDRHVAGASSAIGDRAFHAEPNVVARLGRAMAAGLLAAGVQPVGKHAPGHGQALVDSHEAMPVVNSSDLESDCLPFALNADLPWAMTAHVLYPAWDPTLPATLSPTIIASLIRRRIGFKGVLVTDDLAMHALSGPAADRAVRVLEAGCDVALYCSGELTPTSELLAACPTVTPATAERLAAARALARMRRVSLDAGALAAERERLLA